MVLLIMVENVNDSLFNLVTWTQSCSTAWYILQLLIFLKMEALTLLIYECFDIKTQPFPVI